MCDPRETGVVPHDTDSNMKISQSRKRIRKGKPAIPAIVGLTLTCITIILQCVAFFTPHWKEVSPATSSLYVDGVDALIRTELLHYFNTIHRYTHHSYGLFHHCEYVRSNSSALNLRQAKACTRNFLPSYVDEHFNECHSLPYYRFCAKANERNFDVSHDYLRATFDIATSQSNVDSKVACDCHYPPYVVLCRITCVFAFLCLLTTSLLYALFIYITDPHYRLKARCFGFLAAVLAVLLLLLNLTLVLRHMEFESVDYLIAIQRHYRLNQIYKLSSDTKTAIDRFLASVRIRMGYSGILACIAFALSIVDAILFIAPCRTADGPDEDDREAHAALVPSHSPSANSSPVFSAIPTSPPPPPPPTTANPEQPRPLATLVEDEV